METQYEESMLGGRLPAVTPLLDDHHHHHHHHNHKDEDDHDKENGIDDYDEETMLWGKLPRVTFFYH